MRGSTFEDRLQRMTGTTAPAGPAPAAPMVPATRGRSALTRYDEALALVVQAGHAPSRSLVLRWIASLGVPISPLNYWPAANLFLWAVMLLLIIFGGALSLTEWMFMALDEDRINPEWYAAFRFAYAGVIVASCIMGAIFTFRLRRIANRADLPDWAEV